MKRQLPGRIGAALVLCTLIVFPGCNAPPSAKTKVLVLNAGSLVVPFAEIEKAYELRHPEIDVMCEGHGSVQAIRYVTDIGEPADVVAVADSSLFGLLMYNTPLPNGRGTYADWQIQFATNRLGIAYTEKSLYADEVNDRNWYEILTRPNVRIGFTDPRIDASGYRTMMLTKLAELYYEDDSIFENLISKNFKSPVRSDKVEDGYEIIVPELLEVAGRRLFLRSYSIQLLALLESYEIDYAFEYKSVAAQHGLKFVQLPPEIDLSSELMRDVYGKVRVRLDFRRFKSVSPVFKALPIIYGVTVPNNAPHPTEAQEFLAFLLGPEGQQIMADNRHPPKVPPVADNVEKVPPSLSGLVK